MKKIILSVIVTVAGVAMTFDAVTALLEKPLLTSIYRDVRDHHDAEDLTQNVLVEISARGGEGKVFATREDLKKYAFGIARNMVRRYFKEHRGPRAVASIGDHDPADERAREAFDPSIAVDHLFTLLPHQYAHALHAAYLEGQPVPDYTLCRARQYARKNSHF